MSVSAAYGGRRDWCLRCRVLDTAAESILPPWRYASRPLDILFPKCPDWKSSLWAFLLCVRHWAVRYKWAVILQVQLCTNLNSWQPHKPHPTGDYLLGISSSHWTQRPGPDDECADTRHPRFQILIQTSATFQAPDVHPWSRGISFPRPAAAWLTYVLMHAQSSILS